jgi:hypothetical protein
MLLACSEFPGIMPRTSDLPRCATSCRKVLNLILLLSYPLLFSFTAAIFSLDECSPCYASCEYHEHAHCVLTIHPSRLHLRADLILLSMVLRAQGWATRTCDHPWGKSSSRAGMSVSQGAARGAWGASSSRSGVRRSEGAARHLRHVRGVHRRAGQG